MEAAVVSCFRCLCDELNMYLAVAEVLVPEGVSYWTHAQHYMEVVSHTLYQVVKNGVWSL